MSVSLPRLGLVTPTRHVLVHSNELTLLRTPYQNVTLQPQQYGDSDQYFIMI